MNDDAELYQSANVVQRRDALLYLEEYAGKINWKKSNNRILDVGCGDGGVTSLLKRFIPTSFKLLGCDLSEKMINYANNHHSNEYTSFTVLDIAGDLPESMKGKFDQVVSFYALHWVQDQQNAFNNIYNLLDKNGDCFVIFIVSAPIFDVYRELVKNNKWAELMKDFDKYISPYEDSKDPANDLRKIMENAGFVDIEVKCKNMVYTYENIHIVKRTIVSVNPFNIPKDKISDYMEDCEQELRKMGIVKSYDTGCRFRYRLMVAYARKRSYVS